ncbi:PREDICTED: rho GTPase-activating protein 26-like [Priapulus caudatus]|uniref:Rho GTPase-activating protein 26-like n=1 Tax=Priapulus caudatus TaxID=37621 RepID=A0ABM1F001_PRICU|nr:PREDICTED: rho GTPase-activating protein 26-like [Priapulus caudatus]
MMREARRGGEGEEEGSFPGEHREGSRCLLSLQKSDAGGVNNKMYTRQGYLFLMEKTAFGTKFSKHYCMYQKEGKIFTLIPYHQVQGKITNTDTLKVASCVRRMSESIDKRFCFDITAQDRQGVVYTLQALSDEDRVGSGWT